MKMLFYPIRLVVMMLLLIPNHTHGFFIDWFISEPAVYYMPVEPYRIYYCDATVDEVDTLLRDISHALPDFFADTKNRSRARALSGTMRTITQAWLPFVQDYGYSWGMYRSTLRELITILEEILYTLEFGQGTTVSDAQWRTMERTLKGILNELDFESEPSSLEYVVDQFDQLALTLQRITSA